MIKIQISNPEVLSLIEEEIINLEDAIESIFPLDTEYLILIWNNIFIPLTYKYDISLMVLDFIRILHFLKDDKGDKLEIHWASNTFVSIWKMKKINSSVNIKSEWETVNGGTQDLLNKVNENTLPVSDFEKEIKKILFFLKNSLEKSGLNCHLIEDFEKLEKTCR
ncbi:hypothetical protein FAZ15_14325 [Sphingobacterium olei]|uniref:Uncharacterized protein n=1 Tax=Sphingobacterium olei TaxID=2571155 RepID=A0A4U0NYV1_9SPHI|nr:hypothetical protein [Sphingobacterium olei]TJZ60057.1 hypothetical protein FAZ15_14325 [Sphingobacterium olei]